MVLIFSEEQFAQLAELRFERRLTEILIDADPDAAEPLSTVEGRSVLRGQCTKARRYGLTSEIEIARYVITAWLMGLDFDTRFVAMAELLNSTVLTPEQKAEAIERLATTVLSELHKGRS